MCYIDIKLEKWLNISEERFFLHVDTPRNYLYLLIKF